MVILRSCPSGGGRRFRHSVSAVLLALIAFAYVGCTGEETREGTATSPTPPVVTPEPPRDDAGTRRFQQFLDLAFGKVLAARDFHCVLFRTEMVGDALKPEEEIDFYDRFEPQSLRLEWIGERYKGRQLIYVAGSNDNKILVRPEGVVGILTIKKTLRFALDSPIVRMYGRYPPDVAGYNNLMKKIVDIYGRARKLNLGRVKTSPPAEEAGHKVQRFEVTLEPKLLDVDVSKMVIWFDLQSILPVRTVFYDTNGRMVEDYGWRDLQLNVGLTDEDFTFQD
jgi:hypothetical protein